MNECAVIVHLQFYLFYIVTIVNYRVNRMLQQIHTESNREQHIFVQGWTNGQTEKIINFNDVIYLCCKYKMNSYLS